MSENHATDGKVSRWVSIDLADILIVLGLLLIGAGLWYIYWQAALIVVGTISLALGLLSAWMRSRNGTVHKPV